LRIGTGRAWRGGVQSEITITGIERSGTTARTAHPRRPLRPEPVGKTVKATIYIIRNKKDGRSYVGRTAGLMFARLRQHCTTTDSLIGMMLATHGIDSFEFSTLETTEPDRAAEAEARWITKLRTLWPRGYNVAPPLGGFPSNQVRPREVPKLPPYIPVVEPRPAPVAPNGCYQSAVFCSLVCDHRQRGRCSCRLDEMSDNAKLVFPRRYFDSLARSVVLTRGEGGDDGQRRP